MHCPDQATMTERPNGLVLAGGRSRRMQADKALIDYHGRPQLDWTYELLAPYCAATFVSVRADQHDESRDRHPRIEDEGESIGPAGGMLSAYRRAHCAWLVVACDLPYLSAKVFETLLAQRDPSMHATAYRSASDGLPEPLCAIWEPAGLEWLSAQVSEGGWCPRKALIRGRTKLLAPLDASALDNVNTPHEHAAATRQIRSA